MEFSTVELAQALFVVNRHAKTAPNPKFLYLLKKKTLEKLIKEGKAQKCGLQFSNNPKNSQQHSDVLVSVGDYYFHIPPAKIDFEMLPHLGELKEIYRNPKIHLHLPLIKAKQILLAYTGMEERINDHKKQPPKRKYQKPVFKKLGQSYF